MQVQRCHDTLPAACLFLVRPLPSHRFAVDCYQRKEEVTMPMKAAVLRTLGKPPQLEEFPDPEPSQGEVVRFQGCGSDRVRPVLCVVSGLTFSQQPART
jgi:hypothetical protein